MSFEVVLKKRVVKQLGKLPKLVQVSATELVNDLRSRGPVLPNWPNFSKLGPHEYHCHLKRKWVAVWRHEKDTIVVEVTYVGSREDAPY
jgi:mRNA-degrading endonuclease RelE of RelBE toxin-antitoxin system